MAAFLSMAGAAAAQHDRPQVVATVGMIADVTARLAGDCADVRTMMGPGTDPHLYRPTSSDVRALRAADAIFYAGFGLEGQLGAVLDRMEGTTLTLAIGPSAVPADELITVADLYGVDPHLWMDVRIWAMIVPVIVEALHDLAPDCGDEIAARADAYGARLGALHDWVARAIATIPEERRALVTAHDAFAYFARAYGIDEIGIQGISTESEASISDIRETADLVAARGIPAVFVETTINPRTVEALIAAVRDRGHAIEIGGALYSDAMGDPDTEGGSYIGMIVSNTRTIVQALGGQVPDLPEDLTAALEAEGRAGND